MTQATPYRRSTGFADDERNNVGGRSTVRTAQVDAELDAIAVPLDLTISNLSLLQRDDGVMRDGVVPVSALGADTLKLLSTGTSVVRGAWVTATAYAAKDLVTQSGNTYICAAAHTSGVFATDLGAGKWVLFQIGANPAASAIPFTPTANTTSTTVQTAIVEVDADARALVAATVATLAASTLATDGAGGIGFLSSLAYAAGTVGAYLKTLLANFAASAGSSLVGTIAAGIGAILRTQQSKNRDFVHMRDYGAVCDGVTNDIVALQAAHDAVALAGGGTLYVSKAKLNDTFTRDANKVAIQGDGGLWDFSSLGAGKSSVVEIQSETDINLRCMKNRAHPFRGVRLGGPIGATTVYGINIADTVGNTIPGLIYENGGCAGFVADFVYGAGAFFTTVRDWDLTSDTAGRISQRNWIFPAAANSGERNVWDNVRFGLVTVENISVSNGNSDTVYDKCSWNYAPRFGTLNAGQHKLIAPHLEWSSDADWKFFLAAGGNATLTILAPTYNLAAAQAVKAFAFVDPGLTTTGLTIKDGTVGATNPITVPWADGGGRVTVSNMGRYASTGYMFTPAIGQNMLAYGDFESASFSNEFNCQGTTIPARSTTQAKQGTNSLRFQGIVGQTNFADVSVPCTVVQTVNFSLWYRGDGITGTSTGFQANLRYLDAAGTLLTTIPVFSITADTAGWLLAVPAASFAAAPPGTKTAQLRTIIQGTASGTPLGYIDVVNMVAQ